MISPEQARRILDAATVVHDADTVRQAIARVAVAIDVEIGEANPLVMTVLQGGLFFAGQLLPLLGFPMQQTSVHVSRYSNGAPGDLMWVARPTVAVAGRTVLLVDDVFDEGLTLAAIAAELAEQGAERVCSAVIANKQVPKKSAYRPDFVALECGDEYLFGCGMDVQGYWRNLPAIYAVAS